MSLSTLFYLALGVGLYKLGAYNARYPGELPELVWLLSVRVWRWLNPQ